MKRKKRLHRAHKSGEDAPSFSSVMKSAALALPLTAASALLLLLILTSLLLKTADPKAYHTAAGLFLAYFAAFLCGLIATRLHHRRTPLFCGLAAGAMLLLVQLALSLVLPHDEKDAIDFLWMHALMLPTAGLGAWLGAREKKQSRGSHRAR